MHSLFYIPGTMIGAFVVDYLGPKWTMVRSTSMTEPMLDSDNGYQITGLLLQAVVGFIMSGLYAK